MVACCDVDRAHAERFAAKYEGRCVIYSDYRKLLERKDIDVVTIGTRIIGTPPSRWPPWRPGVMFTVKNR